MLIKGRKKRGEPKISFCYRRGSGTFPQSFSEPGGVIWCVWSVCRWLSQWWLKLRSMPLSVMGFIIIVSFIHKKNWVLLSHIYNCFLKKAINGCEIWKHLHRFREVKRLQGCSKTLQIPCSCSILSPHICSISNRRRIRSPAIYMWRSSIVDVWQVSKRDSVQ